MKNKFKLFLITSILFILIHKISYSKEITINSQEINLYDNGNILVSINGSASSKEDSIEIFADRIEYNKKRNLLNANNALTILDSEETEIKSKQIRFDKKESLLEAFDTVKLTNKKENIFIEANSIKYDIKKKLIISKSKSKIIISDNNFLESDFLSYNIETGILKLENLKLIDEFKNETILEK